MSTITAPRIHSLDPGRITAGAGAIALNAALMMLLMVPIAAPPMIERNDVVLPDIVFVKPKQPEPKADPVEVEVKPSVRRPDARPLPVPVPPQPFMPTTDQPQAGDTVVPPADPPAIDLPPGAASPGGDGQPMQGAHLEYASAPAPAYPRDALREGLTGTVMLQVLVDVDGRPLEVTVARSSGHRTLDIAAKRQVLARWTFRPAVRDGRPVQAIGVIPVEFTLD